MRLPCVEVVRSLHVSLAVTFTGKHSATPGHSASGVEVVTEALADRLHVAEVCPLSHPPGVATGEATWR